MGLTKRNARTNKRTTRTNKRMRKRRNKNSTSKRNARRRKHSKGVKQTGGGVFHEIGASMNEIMSAYRGVESSPPPEPTRGQLQYLI